MHASRQGRALLAALCAVVVVAYLPALAGPFHFDDHLTVAAERASRSLAAWWEGLAFHVRPILKASFVVTGAFAGLVGEAPTAHRLGNLVIHLAATLAFHAFGRRASAALEPWRDARTREWHALAAAAVFALHPLSTEAVSYVSGRSASLAALASVLAMLAWMNAHDSSGRARAGWFIAGVVSFLLALGSREAAIATPFAWLLLEALRPRDVTRDTARARALAAFAGAMIVAVAFLAWMAFHPRYGALLELSTRIAEARMHEHALATALGYLGCVAALVCAPNIDPAPPLAGGWQSFALLASLSAASVLALRARTRHPMALFALGWAALWLLPLYALPIRHDLVSERHAYPAVWSLGWLAGAIFAHAWARPAPLRHAGTAAAAMLLATLLPLTIERNREYRSEVALWEASARESAPRVRVLNNLGVAYIGAGRWAEAQRVLQAARALDPDNAVVEMNLARAQRRSET